MSERTPDRVALLPGDGIGPEVTDAAKRLLHQFDIETEEYPFGHDSIGEHGEPLTDEVLAACETADAVLLGAVGTPPEEAQRLKREGSGDEPTAEQGLLRLRKELECFANLRPMMNYVPDPDRSRVDLVIVRELLGGAYRGEGRPSDEEATDVIRYSRSEIERVAAVAFELATERALEADREPRVVSADKANVLNTSKLWRKTVEAVSRRYPDVAIDHRLIDNVAMQLAAHPERFDVIVTENLMGDILSDESAGVIHGSLGLAPSASLGESGRAGTDIFESVHGAAFDIAGEGRANPLATFFSTALLLRHGLKRPEDAMDLEEAAMHALYDSYRTPDMVPEGRENEFTVVSTNEMTDVVSDMLADRLSARD